ncbi:MAG: hypothetical protein U9N57_14175 [Pseudomonadota bacterium]|nr:hypothetical protein [Pseudomonadota bacterium]
MRLYVKAILLLAVMAVTFPSYSDEQCTPPGERAYHEEWMLTESQSLLHKCALGGLVNFNVLSIFDPSQMLLDIIKGKACSFVRQKMQPYRDDLNAQVDSINSQITSFHDSQTYDAWEERTGGAWEREDPFSQIEPANIEGSNFSGQSVAMESPVVETVFNYGQQLDNGSSTSPTGGVFIPPEETQAPVTDGLIDRGGSTGLPTYPLPTPKDWGDIYQGTVQ